MNGVQILMMNQQKKSIYRYLYNWYAVSTANFAPSGWHVPTNTEYYTLSTYLGGTTFVDINITPLNTIPNITVSDLWIGYSYSNLNGILTIEVNSFFVDRSGSINLIHPYNNTKTISIDVIQKRL